MSKLRRRAQLALRSMGGPSWRRRGLVALLLSIILLLLGLRSGIGFSVIVCLIFITDVACFADVWINPYLPHIFAILKIESRRKLMSSAIVLFGLIMLGALMLHFWGLGHVSLTACYTVFVWIALVLLQYVIARLTTSRIALRFLGALTDITKGVLASLFMMMLYPAPVSTPSKPVAAVVSARSDLSPILEAAIARRGSSSSASLAGSLQLIPREELTVEEIRSNGTPLIQILAILTLADSRQSQGLLNEADRLTKEIEELRSRGKWVGGAHDRDYRLVKGYRFLLSNNPIMAIRFLDEESSIQDVSTVILLCSALLDSEELDEKSANLERVIQLTTQALTRSKLDAWARANLIVRQVSAQFLLGRTPEARVLIEGLGDANAIKNGFEPRDAISLLMMRGQMEFRMNESWPAAEVLDLAQNLASQIIPESHPDYAAIRIAQANVFLSLNRLKEAGEALKDIRSFLDNGVAGGHPLVPAALCAGGAVMAARARAEGNSSEADESWKEAIEYYNEGLKEHVSVFGQEDIRTLQTRSNFALILWECGKHDLATQTMKPLIEIIRRNKFIGHPDLEMPFRYYALMKIYLLGMYTEDAGYASNTEVQDVYTLSNCANNIAQRVLESLDATKPIPVGILKSLEIQATEALGQFIDVCLLSGDKERAYKSSLVLIDRREKLYGKTDWRCGTAIAYLGRAELLKGELGLAEKHLHEADQLIAANSEIGPRPRWQLYRALCRLYEQKNEPQNADEWRGKARLIRELISK
jgi:tetratricopeptide (TPR) repeat protein